MEKPKISFTSYDDLFGDPNEVKKETIEVSLSELHEFKGHPFKVRDDRAMAELADSIRTNGVIIPGIVRERREGGYEIIAGHRRRRASELIGKETMPVVIRNLSDEMAINYMVDSNIQREDILPSEKAHAYKMRAAAMKLNKTEENGRKDEKIAKEFGESRNQIRRYMRLVYLIPELLDLVDERKIPVNVGYELSFLCIKSMQRLFVFINDFGTIPSISQASLLREKEREKTSGELDNDDFEETLRGKMKEPTRKIVLKSKQLNQFFPPEYSAEDAESVIIELLEHWSEGKNE